MAVAYVDSSFGNATSGDVTPAGSDRVLICDAMSDGTADHGATACNFNGAEAMTDIAASHTSGTTGEYQELWVLVAPTTSTASCSTGTAEGHIAMAVSGADQTTPIPSGDIVISESGSSTSLSVNVPNVGADDLVFAIISINGANTGWTPDGTTREDSNTAGWSRMLITKTGSGTVSIGGSGWGAARGSIVGGRIASTGGGGGGRTTRNTRAIRLGQELGINLWGQ